LRIDLSYWHSSEPLIAVDVRVREDYDIYSCYGVAVATLDRGKQYNPVITEHFLTSWEARQIAAALIAAADQSDRTRPR
jgi:hypothetical protein